VTDLPRILLTSGEPAGIGPDLCVEIASKNWPCELIVVGDKQMLETRARMLGRAITVVDYVRVHPDQRANALLIANINAATPAVPGKLDRANASYVLETLKFAADGCMRGDFDAVVTAPVQKSIINDAGIPFSGHTEFFAEQTGGSKPVMMLVADSLRVALATTHLPLTAVSAAITRASLEEIIRIIDRDLRTRFGIAAPRVLVCGLNPHAGEGGHLGREEIEVIEPVLAALRTQGFMLIGPAPADTAFTPRMLAQADCVLAMYHDHHPHVRGSWNRA